MGITSNHANCKNSLAKFPHEDNKSSVHTWCLAALDVCSEGRNVPAPHGALAELHSSSSLEYIGAELTDFSVASGTG